MGALDDTKNKSDNMKNKAEADSLRSIAVQFRKLSDLADTAATAYEEGNKGKIESTLKGLMWESLKMQKI